MKEKKIALLLIDSINNKGYLDCNLETLSVQEKIDKADLVKVLKVIQKLDPVGVGARSVSECLMIQILSLNLQNGIIELIAKDFLELVAQKNYNLIAKAIGIDTLQVKKKYK